MPERMNHFRLSSVCLACRRAWKHRLGVRSCCPECGAVGLMMGRDFKPPRRLDEAQWRKLELAIGAGLRLSGQRTLREVKTEVAGLRAGQTSAALCAEALRRSDERRAELEPRTLSANVHVRSRRGRAP